MSLSAFYRILAAVLLVGMGIHRYATMPSPSDLAPYQARIRQAAQKVPRQIGGWVGEDAPVPARSDEVLRPNVVLSRRYINVENGSAASVFLVHCSDAHHMAGHFPLRCYPAQGWTLHASHPQDWTVSSMTITGTLYEFTMDAFDRNKSTIVANCLLLPRGQVLRDMSSMARKMAGVGGRSQGAGQLQVCFDANMPPPQRDEAIRTLINGYKPVIDAILANPLQ